MAPDWQDLKTKEGGSWTVNRDAQWVPTDGPAPWPTRETLEALIGHPIAPAIWELQPWGRHLLVLNEPAERKVGSIVVPDAHQETKGVGWVLRVGQDVGVPEPGYNGSPLVGVTLAGLRVLYSKWAGTAVMVHSKVDDILGDYLIIREADVYGHLPPGEEPTAVDNGGA